ncbi:MAG: hypothetical protein R3A52_25885 [Polyangiales bacterium]
MAPFEVGSSARCVSTAWIRAIDLSLSVFVAEVVAFVRVACARSGRCRGLAVRDDAPQPWPVSALPSWRLTVDDRLRRSCTPRSRADTATTPAQRSSRGIPAATTWSWRLWVLPLAVAFRALRLAR